MIRLPNPPKKMTVPAPPIDFLNKFNEVITFQQNLASALEQQQRTTDLSTSASTKNVEDVAEAKGWFNG
jgi:hypothetical protein